MLVLQQRFLYLERRGGKEWDLFKTATFAALFQESVMKGASATVSLSFSSPHSGLGLSHSPPSLTTSWCMGNHVITICNQKKKMFLVSWRHYLIADPRQTDSTTFRFERFRQGFVISRIWGNISSWLGAWTLEPDSLVWIPCDSGRVCASIFSFIKLELWGLN